MVMSDYTFPGVVQPFDLQVKTVEFLLNDTRKKFVFNQIGTGKTFAAVWAMDIKIQAGDIRKILIISPKSTQRSVWQHHLGIVGFGRWDVQIIEGTSQKKIATLIEAQKDDRTVKVNIITPQSLHLLINEKQCAIVTYDLIIVDESAGFRNVKTRKCKALQILQAQSKYLWCMTGSPTPEAPTDLYVTGKMVSPETFPRSFTAMKLLTMDRVSNFVWRPKREAISTIVEWLRGKYCLYTREELNLEKAITQVLKVEPSAEQVKATKELMRDAYLALNQGTLTPQTEADMMSKLLQIAGGAVKAKDKESKRDTLERIKLSGKVDALMDILDANKYPAIVYTPFLGHMEIVSEILRDRWRCAQVSGQTSSGQRAQIFSDFQRCEYDCMIAQPAAMAHGITLTASNVVIWWTPPMGHEVFEQANGRIDRVGQKSVPFIIMLSCSPIENKVIGRLQQKSKIQGGLIELLRG